MLDLALYTGDKQVEPDCKAMTHTPTSMGPRHAPLAHATLHETIVQQCEAMGLAIVQSVHALTNHDDVYMGIAEMYSTVERFAPILAWRASHNQRVSAKLYLGVGTRELDNLCLINEVRVVSRQTLKFQDRLPQLIQDSLFELLAFAKHQRSAFYAFERTRLSDAEAEQAIVEMIRRDIISSSKALQVIGEWDMPDAQQLRGSRNLWRLFNAVAGSYKPMGKTDALSALVDRSPSLMAFCKDMLLQRIE